MKNTPQIHPDTPSFNDSDHFTHHDKVAAMVKPVPGGYRVKGTNGIFTYYTDAFNEAAVLNMEAYIARGGAA